LRRRVARKPEGRGEDAADALAEAAVDGSAEIDCRVARDRRHRFLGPPEAEQHDVPTTAARQHVKAPSHGRVIQVVHEVSEAHRLPISCVPPRTGSLAEGNGNAPSAGPGPRDDAR
jgi:hypothetical protein